MARTIRAVVTGVAAGIVLAVVALGKVEASHGLISAWFLARALAALVVVCAAAEVIVQLPAVSHRRQASAEETEAASDRALG